VYGHLFESDWDALVERLDERPADSVRILSMEKKRDSGEMTRDQRFTLLRGWDSNPQPTD